MKGATSTKRWREFALRVALLVTSTYMSLLLVEAWLSWRARPIQQAIVDRGLYLADSVLGVVLKPGYDASFNDGYTTGRVTINSLGNRDNEPGADSTPVSYTH
jgi:hypothetical protein